MNLPAALAQLVGVVAAPLLPGLIQSLKARLQGRRGPSPLQPYRTLRRLWRRSRVQPAGAGAVYRLAPAVVAACMLIAVAIVPVAGRGGSFGLGHDALTLLGVLALSRFVTAAAAWETGNGFALMGAARELTVAVSVEALLLLTLLLAALAGHGTDLRLLSATGAGWAPWRSLAHWSGLLAFGLVVLAETGRQPIDNPDTHLELTMIHEGPLLEYAGPDLALLQWAAAARHWVVMVLGAELFLPHPAGFLIGLVALAGLLAAQCTALAVIETAQAKMRLLRVPVLVGFAGVVVLAAIFIRAAGVSA